MRKKCPVLASVHVITEASLSQVIAPTDRVSPKSSVGHW
jgi:hypothetical protein